MFSSGVRCDYTSLIAWDMSWVHYVRSFLKEIAGKLGVDVNWKSNNEGLLCILQLS